MHVQLMQCQVQHAVIGLLLCVHVGTPWTRAYLGHMEEIYNSLSRCGLLVKAVQPHTQIPHFVLCCRAEGPLQKAPLDQSSKDHTPCNGPAQVVWKLLQSLV